MIASTLISCSRYLTIQVPTSIEGWGVEGIRRASINSFGYGGTNAHAIIDDALHYLRSRSLPALHRKTPSLLPKQLGSMVSYASGGDVAAGGVSSNKKVFTISAFDEKAGKRQAENIATYLDERSQLVGSEMLEHLAFTLNERRTNFPWKTAVSAGSVDSLLSLLRDEDLKFSKTTKPPTIAFVFTGQGAQWNAMGRQLFTAYPVYRESIERSSRKLRAIGAPWDLLGTIFLCIKALKKLTYDRGTIKRCYKVTCRGSGFEPTPLYSCANCIG